MVVQCLNLDDECDVTGETGAYFDYWNKVDLPRENRLGYHNISYIIHPVSSAQRLVTACMVRVSNPGGEFSLSRPDRSEAQPAPCTFGTGSFPGLKKPVRFADRPHSSSAEVANGLKLYFHLLSILEQARHGLTFICASNFQSVDGLSLTVCKPLSEFIKGDKNLNMGQEMACVTKNLWSSIRVMLSGGLFAGNTVPVEEEKRTENSDRKRLWK